VAVKAAAARPEGDEAPITVVVNWQAAVKK
jgi:hypothetical protein